MKESLLYSTVNYKTNYKLIPLTSELVSAIKNSEGLLIKSSSNSARDLVITSDSTTFHLRQKNHSNTQLLIKSLDTSTDRQNLLATVNFNDELELKSIPGFIEYNHLPIYLGDFKKFLLEDNLESVEQVLLRSPISSKEFYRRWIEVNGTEIDGKAALLSKDYVTEILSLIINITIAHGMDVKSESVNLTKIYQLVDAHLKDGDDQNNVVTIDIIHTILLKFSQGSQFNDSDFKLDLPKISTWYGIHSLKTFASQQNVAVDEFLINWRSTLPSSLSIDLDLSMLRGHYYSPYPGLIRYINRQTLPSEPLSRFKNLFLLQSQWLLEEIEPFVADLNTKNLKASSFIMKFARVKKQGSKTIVISR